MTPSVPDERSAGVPSSPPMWQSGTLDEEALDRLRELDPTGQTGLLERVLRTFDGSLQRLMQQLQQARQSSDYVAMRHVAHTLKSSSASVGALALSQLCAELERDLREEKNDSLEALLNGMIAESNHVLAMLKSMLRPQSGGAL